MSVTPKQAEEPLGQIYSREATGLVKQGTPSRAMLLNFANIGLTYIMFTYWLHPGSYPRSNLLLALLVAEIFIIPFMLLYWKFASAMPRTGSEYVYISRTIHPAWGFSCSFAAAMSQSFWTGVGGFWIAQLVLSPMFSAFGNITGNDTLVGLGETFAGNTAGFIIGSVFLWFMVYLNVRGLKAYFKFQKINWFVGGLTLLLLVIVFLVSTTADFANNFNDFAQSATGTDNAYNTVLQEAESQGMPGGFALKDLLAIFPIVWLVAWASTYIGGEVQDPRRTQLWGTLGGSLLYFGVVFLQALLIAKAVGLDFNRAAAWLSLNSETWYEIVPNDPVYILWAGVLIDNLVLLLVVGAGFVLWSYLWIPSAMIIATRAMFAWSFDRIMPQKLSDVHPKYNSPYVAVIVVGIIAQLFLIAYATEVFQVLQPALAYMVVFLSTSIAGILFPYLKKTRHWFDQPGIGTRFLGLPVMVWGGVAGAIYFGVALWYMLTDSLLGFNVDSEAFGMTAKWALILAALQFLVPLSIYFLVKQKRAREAIPLEAAFKGLPPD
jgi:amino acid transporter